MRDSRRLLILLAALAACADETAPPPITTVADPGLAAGNAGVGDFGSNDRGHGHPVTVTCAPDNGGIALPSGFCATVFADHLGKARHITVAPSGHVFVAIEASSPT